MKFLFANARLIPLFALALCTASAVAQGSGTGSVQGTVSDPTGAVIPGATVHLVNKASGLSRSAATDAAGQFEFPNLPFHPYQIDLRAAGFSAITQTVNINSTQPISLALTMQVAESSETVTVESDAPMLEDTSTFHTEMDRDQFNRIPLESASSSLSSLVTQTTPGVSADSNGLFHGLGDHASNSFSVDGQPITDQQSKVFSNQLPSNAVQSIEVIEGAPPAQYGDKTSLVIVATTRSGQGVSRPTGSVSTSYGSFGSATAGYNVAYGGQRWGHFFEIDGLNTGRFLDPPEFAVMHDKGNELNVFDRSDHSFTQNDSVHLNLNFSRSWFQNPNAYDNLGVRNVVSGGASASPVFAVIGNTDQRSQIRTFNIAPAYMRILSKSAVLNMNVYTRRDEYNYYPSPNPLADLGPADLQTSSISQLRTLTNAGAHIDFTYAHGPHNIMAGVQYNSTFLRENDSLGIVASTYNSPCLNSVTGNPLPGYSGTSQCTGVTTLANPNFIAALAPYDLTRGGKRYAWFGHADVKELSFYAEDEIKLGQWNLRLGVRDDKYNGLAAASQIEPRLGLAYHVKRTSTVLSISYARTLETPFNENLALSSRGCEDAVLAPLLSCTSGVNGNLRPGFRNEFHVSFQQALGKDIIFSGEYIWKYTHNAFDFSVLGNTPIAFPIDWHNSKIPGVALHLQVPRLHNISGYFDASSVSARFFPPQVSGAGATVGQVGLPFRIDHDEKFNSTAHIQYTVPGGKLLAGVWGGLNWRYDSGQVAGSAPCYGVTDPNSPCGNSSVLAGGQPAIALVDNNAPAALNPVTGKYAAIALTADQQFQAGLICDGQKATPTTPLPAVCAAGKLTSSLIRIPAPGTSNSDSNPPRIAPRSLFDVNIGKDNIFHRDRYKVDLDVTAINVTNTYALYNFLSTFSGTHYITPRAVTAKVSLNF